MGAITVPALVVICRMDVSYSHIHWVDRTYPWRNGSLEDSLGIPHLTNGVSNCIFIMLWFLEREWRLLGLEFCGLFEKSMNKQVFSI